jgi:hypothetical protein
MNKIFKLKLFCLEGIHMQFLGLRRAMLGTSAAC